MSTQNNALSYLQRGNLEFIEQMYLQYKSTPQSVSEDWRLFFEGVDFSQTNQFGLSEKELDVYHLIQAYRNYGHFEADLDPLSNSTSPSDQLRLSRFKLKDSDLDQKFQIGRICGLPNATLRDIIAHLKKCYCGKITVQCAEALPETRDWFIKEFEQTSISKLTNDQKISHLQYLTKAEALEKFIHTRFVGAKRFSIEGGDALIPMMEHLVERSAQLGAEEMVIGMAHRGRVNVLANIFGKKPEYIFADFLGPVETNFSFEDYDGDVKYHLGYSCDRQTSKGTYRMNLAFNPSHLEAVNPVVMGMSRAAQRKRLDTKTRKKVIPVLIHGDAAFAGQGIVAETFQMANVTGYTVGGTIHIAIDNQVGFTTNPDSARSSHYCSDISKVLATPVIHVNGDDIESCVRAIDMAIRYRQETGLDIVVTLMCYRRYGHNEGDEPAYTQPLMYELIKKHPTVREIYAKQLTHENVIDSAFSEKIFNEQINLLQAALEKTKVQPPKVEPFKFDGLWKGLKKAEAKDLEAPTDTTFKTSDLKKLGKQLAEYPEGFSPHPKLLKLLENRKNMVDGKEQLDWGTAELLSYATLLSEGTSVRITGQDVMRGTFTHRHAVLFDHKTGEAHCALKNINNEKTEYCIYNSVLSEYGVLGFEYGNSIWDPTFLTIWEAQFGDFANGAQIMIDQFLVSGESKWQQMSGLVLLLPHGYEGQGPEHSSARLERFLQLSAQNNIQVCNLTTPAQIYHALRRQIKRSFRKPLIVMSPKSLLRHPKAVSSMEELSMGTFQEVILDATVTDGKKVDSIVFCSGKIYYELLEEKEKSKKQNVALVRVEQLYPTPWLGLKKALMSYPTAKNFIWCQEEPKNQGAWQHIYFKFEEFFQKEKLNSTLKYAGRGDKASPATGSVYRHKTEQTDFIQKLFQSI